GPGGVAILLEVATDNRNRTAQDVRHLFARHGGNLGESGSVGWIFRRRGYFAIERGGTRTMSEEEFMDLALELGVDDIAVEEDRYEMYSAPEDFTTIHEALESRNVQLAAKELAMVPQTTIDVPADRIGQVLRLMEALEDHDDVQKAWANFNVDERVMSAMADR
ncbi:MAG TPA: YebC/PmpR family DNA-binding transcriptional regulator, partial [Thermoanaerobaculia bacterium]|nr:YebC/PmpR family DNA-binding transcriptional regulator [Thermoanaerobaculia bacterium]